jgi:hypothetical protein
MHCVHIIFIILSRWHGLLKEGMSSLSLYMSLCSQLHFSNVSPSSYFQREKFNGTPGLSARTNSSSRNPPSLPAMNLSDAIAVDPGPTCLLLLVSGWERWDADHEMGAHLCRSIHAWESMKRPVLPRVLAFGLAYTNHSERQQGRGSTI